MPPKPKQALAPKKEKETKVSALLKTDGKRKPVVSTSSKAGIKFPPARI